MENCKNCGAGNDVNAKFCSSCGTKLSGKPGNAKGQTHQNKNSNKKLIVSSKTVIIFIVVLGIIGIINLVSAGVFDSPAISESTETHQHNTNPNDPHRGIDMSQLQRINGLEEQVKSNPNDFAKLLELAHLYNDSGFKEKAIEKYKTYLKSNPNNADVWVDMGVCFYELQNYPEAIKCMEKGIELNSRHQIAHFNMGIINLAQNNVNIAKEWWQKAINIDPNSRLATTAKDLIAKN